MAAQKQIAARLQGDDYQARFFWYKAALLLIPGSSTCRVKLEDGDAPYVDDVTVFYDAPGRRDQGRDCQADFFQVKFHVDQRKAYCSDGMCDPDLIGSKTKSLLQRFFSTFNTLRVDYDFFTLCLVSNWAWSRDDDLAVHIRHSGSLPDRFCSAGPTSKLGKIRHQWQTHLGTDDATFTDFASRLRLKLNYFGHGDFNAALNDRLYRAGLTPLDPTRDGSLYDDLGRKFIVAGSTVFDADRLHNTCEREGLLRHEPPTRSTRRIGFRTFIPFAEVIEAETDAFICGADLFDGRHPRSASTWGTLYQRFSDFVDVQRPQLASEHEVLLDCHASAALIAGYLLTARAAAWPVGPRPNLEAQRPTIPPLQDGSDVWTVNVHELGKGPDIAVAFSITHRTLDDVKANLQGQESHIGRLIEFIPVEGHGYNSVRDADHAIAFVEAALARTRQESPTEATKHLFISAPNFFTFFLGQRVRALGSIVVYEYDFDRSGSRGYQASLHLPFAPIEAPEVHHDSQDRLQDIPQGHPTDPRDAGGAAEESPNPPRSTGEG